MYICRKNETMSKIKPYKEQEKNKMSLGEPIMDVTVNAQNRRMPDYVREDVRIGLEQYARGEYEDAWVFLKKLER